MIQKLSFNLTSMLLLISLLLHSSSAFAGVVIIASIDLKNKLTANDIEMLYTGIKKNNQYILLNIRGDDSDSQNNIRTEFFNKFLKSNENRLKIKWSELIFSGYRAPIDKKDNKEVFEFIENNKNSFGYVTTDFFDKIAQPSDKITVISRLN